MTEGDREPSEVAWLVSPMEPSLEEKVREELVRPVAQRQLEALREEALYLTKRAFELSPELPDEIFDATLASAVNGLDEILAGIIRGDDPDNFVVPAESRALAELIAQHGLPVDMLVRMSRSAHSYLLRRWTAEVREAADEDLVVAAENYCERTLFAWFDVLDRRWAEAYYAEVARLAADTESVREEIIRSILSGGATDTVAVGRRLGYRLDGPHRGFLLWGDPDQEASRSALAGLTQVLSEAFRAPVVTLRLDAGSMAGWVASSAPLPADALRAVLRKSDPPMKVAFGSAHDGLAGFTLTHHEAGDTRRVVEISEGRVGGLVHEHSDVAFVALATADIDAARRFIHQELGRLAAQDDDTVRIASTLRVYFAEMGTVARTARRLGVHKNTVLYRLQQAEELLGRSINERRLELQLALDLARTIGVGPPDR